MLLRPGECCNVFWGILLSLERELELELEPLSLSLSLSLSDLTPCFAQDKGKEEG